MQSTCKDLAERCSRVFAVQCSVPVHFIGLQFNMTLLSKHLVLATGRVVIQGGAGLPAGAGARLPAGGQVRSFRWDGKADNVQGHSFFTGLRAGAHPYFWAIAGIFAVVLVDWNKVRKRFGIGLPAPLLVTEALEYMNADYLQQVLNRQTK